MYDNAHACAQIEELLATWINDPTQAKPAFVAFKDWLAKQDGVTLEYKARPGVSFSLRAAHTQQKNRPLFVLVDIVDDEPENRWLSVCFYADMVSDPDELGDFVPTGLMGSDARCLNLDEDNAAMREYIQSRLEEALAAARTCQC